MRWISRGGLHDLPKLSVSVGTSPTVRLRCHGGIGSDHALWIRRLPRWEFGVARMTPVRARVKVLWKSRHGYVRLP
jgi:hypothetical protein